MSTESESQFADRPNLGRPEKSSEQAMSAMSTALNKPRAASKAIQEGEDVKWPDFLVALPVLDKVSGNLTEKDEQHWATAMFTGSLNLERKLAKPDADGIETVAADFKRVIPVYEALADRVKDPKHWATTLIASFTSHYDEITDPVSARKVLELAQAANVFTEDEVINQEARISRYE